jgi:hypothetical protein
MKNIDQVLGTNTYFHEIKNYEERIDSEHAMERKIVKVGEVKKVTLYDKLMDFDPQKRRIMPKIRNFNEFTK